jgi:serine/threonine protein kinase
MVLRVADSCFVTLAGRELGSSRHRSECCEVAPLVGGTLSEERYALKVCHDDTSETRNAFLTEIRALERCRSSPFIPSLHRACERQLVLIQELAAFDLSKISLMARMPLSWVRWVMAGLVLALESLHTHRCDSSRSCACAHTHM